MMLNTFFPPPLVGLLTEIEELGFSLCLVGGSVRDYLAQGVKSRDLDFEIRSREQIADDAWPDFYKNLVSFFERKKMKVTLFPYMITKVDFLEWNLEFSSPRKEIFEDENVHTHHNFTAYLSSNLTFTDSFSRRDFTVNALGFELSFKNNSMRLVDPFGGEKHLKEKRLCLIDDNFFKDSVRFLRLIRFSIKYQMTIDPLIKDKLSSFNLSALSKYHFTSELFKTDPGEFLKLWRILVTQHQLQAPKEFDIWLDSSFDWPLKKLESKEDILIYVFLTHKESAIKVQNFFSLPQKKLRDLNQLFSIPDSSNISKDKKELIERIKKFGDFL